MDRKLGIYQVSDIRLDVNICECNVSIYIYIYILLIECYLTILAIYFIHYTMQFSMIQRMKLIFIFTTYFD